jgi:hypothetical protein
MIVPNNMNIPKFEGCDYSKTQRANLKGCNNGHHDKQRSSFYAEKKYLSKEQ